MGGKASVTQKEPTTAYKEQQEIKLPEIPRFEPGSKEQVFTCQFVELFTQAEELHRACRETFGAGLLKLFDFISSSLPQKDVQQLRFYNKRAFVIFDKCSALQQLKIQMRDELQQLVTGFQKYPEMRQILIKGAEKSYDDSVKTLHGCKTIQKYFDREDKVADFFEVVYEKYESEIEGFIATTLNDVKDANQFYKLKTKILDRKLKGLQQIVVKQSFEISNNKSQYKNDISQIQNEMQDLKMNFSQNLAEVKSSIIYNDHFEDESQPEVEYIPMNQESHEQLEDHKSNNSFMNSVTNSHKRGTKSMKKLDEVYQKILKRNETMTNRSNTSRVSNFSRSYVKEAHNQSQISKNSNFDSASQNEKHTKSTTNQHKNFLQEHDLQHKHFQSTDQSHFARQSVRDPQKRAETMNLVKDTASERSRFSHRPPLSKKRTQLETEPDQNQLGKSDLKKKKTFAQLESSDDDEMDGESFSKLVNSALLTKSALQGSKSSSTFVKPSDQNRKSMLVGNPQKQQNTTINEAKTTSEDDSSKLTQEKKEISGTQDSHSANTNEGKSFTNQQNTLTFCKTSPAGSRGPSVTRKENLPPSTLNLEKTPENPFAP